MRSNDTEESMMADAYNRGSKNNSPSEEGSVVSNLPLLFANGYPTSLEKITLTQLERFVTFMVQCSLGHDTAEVIAQPQWWPKEVKFSNPLTRPSKVNENWMANLKKLVFRCYTYHRSEYILRFCSYLARYPQEDLVYIENWDSTTSLYHKTTGKLLVTFRNENMDYDKKCEGTKKKLLFHGGIASGYCNNKLKQHQQDQEQQHSNMMVEPETEDIYLCDNCDAEFVGLEKMKEHERTCCEQEYTEHNLRPTTPDVSTTVKPELKQDQFLEYLHLCPIRAESKKSMKTNEDTDSREDDSTVRRTSRRVRGSINFTRCPTIPFSSPAGILLAKKSKAMTEETQKERLERIERHLIAPILNDSSRPKWLEAEVDPNRWIVTHKPNREKTGYDYVHEYKFVNSVKKKPMLSIKSQLLYVVCRPVHVVLTRLTQKQINDFEEGQWKCRCVARDVSVGRKETTTESPERVRPNVSLKRKAPSDESDSNIVEANEEVINSKASVGNSIQFKNKTLSERNVAVVKPIQETTFRAKSTDTVTLIDLCSSDEDENPIVDLSSDENRDTMNCIANDVTKSILQKLSSTKFHLKPRIRSTEQKGEWLSNNILNEAGENYVNKYSNALLDATTNLSPIFRSVP